MRSYRVVGKVGLLVLLLVIPAYAIHSVPARAQRPADAASAAPSGIPGVDWQMLATSRVPSAREQAAFAYDSHDAEIVMFGGWNHNPKGPPYFGDTWVLKNRQWTELNESVAPPARRGAMMAYYPPGGYLLLYGGSNGTTYLNDTWKFRGGVWAEIHPRVSPPARRSAGMTYDATDRYMLLFGGHNGSGTNPTDSSAYASFNDAWSFALGKWTLLHPQGSPPRSAEPFFSYDPADNYTVLYGGYNEGNRGHSEYTMNWTWTFVHDRWTNISGSVGTTPTWRDGGALVFDPRLGVLYMMGGDDLIPPLLDTWGFVHGQWYLLNRTGAAPDRCGNHAAWDTVLHAEVTFGVPTNGTTGAVIGSPGTWYDVLAS